MREDPDTKFGPKPDRIDQMGPYESGYRDGYSAAMARWVEALAKFPSRKKEHRE